MDFSISGSDSWDSTPAQDNFISQYFKDKIISKVSGKKAKKIDLLNKQTTSYDNLYSPSKSSTSATERSNSFKNVEKEKSPINKSPIKSKKRKKAESESKSNRFENEPCIKKKKRKTLKQSLNVEADKMFDSSVEQCLKINTKDICLEDHSSGKVNPTYLSKAEQKLQAAKFRCLNEMLYTESGSHAFEYFQDNKNDFMNYHLGYRSQVLKWPINPVDVIIDNIKTLKSKLVIADLGCGDAKISRSFPNWTVHSFDVIALNKNVVACDISKTPLPNESVDIAVFCLSLMGTNLKDFIYEAHRILKIQGILKIAEVQSRICDTSQFVKNVQNFGFCLEKQKISSKMFIHLDFKKVKRKLKRSKLPVFSLKPCLYKKR